MRSVLHSIVFIAMFLAPTLCAKANDNVDQAKFPIEIKHAFGTTVIEKKPERVATIAWANHEVPLALGIVPVGFAAANFGDEDGDGLLPWVANRLAELNAAKPNLFDEGDGIDFEAVAVAQPDVILAAYSGINQADYDTLSQIAPVIAYPNAPWSTDWRDMIRLNSAGLGMASEGNQLIAKIETEIFSKVANYPKLAGKKAIFVTHLDPTNLSTINFYTANDTRVKFFTDLGLQSPKSVIDATLPGKFSGSISAEKLDMFDDVDLVVSYGSKKLLNAVKKDQLLAHLPALKNDSVVLLNRDAIGTAANPTPLSITYVLEDYLKLLANAVDNEK
jgi:iron complex transport system substrate-binding protein